MWLKCGTKIRNEINEVKKSVFFFGSGIYPKKISFRQFCAAIREPAPLPVCGAIERCKGGYKRLKR